MNNFYLRFNHEIWQNDDLTLGQRLVLNFVWNFCVRTGYCYASNRYIAEIFNMRVEDVTKLIDELLADDHIKILEKEPKRIMSVNLSRYPIAE